MLRRNPLLKKVSGFGNANLHRREPSKGFVEAALRL